MNCMYMMYNIQIVISTVQKGLENIFLKSKQTYSAVEFVHGYIWEPGTWIPSTCLPKLINHIPTLTHFLSSLTHFFPSLTHFFLELTNFFPNLTHCLLDLTSLCLFNLIFLSSKHDFMIASWNPC